LRLDRHVRAQVEAGALAPLAGQWPGGGVPKGPRAVGRANGSNMLALVIPCHRVINADGSLCGYAGGLWRKQRLLEHERKYLPALTKAPGPAPISA